MSTAVKDQQAPKAKPRKTSPMHTPEHVVPGAGHWALDDAGERRWRLVFSCPSSRAGVEPHRFTVWEDGAVPRCSCEAFRAHGRCGLSEAAREIVAAYHRDTFRQSNSKVLWQTDQTFASRSASGWLSTDEQAAWDALGDEIAARYAAKAGEEVSA